MDAAAGGLRSEKSDAGQETDGSGVADCAGQTGCVAPGINCSVEQAPPMQTNPLRTTAYLVVLAIALTPQSRAEQPSDDIIYFNGNFITEWPGHESVQAVAIRGN